ncbi:MAG: CRISPR-associated protein Cas4 [Ruminococcus flavefaciens]|nr:CRISPR-associated protein Cas4 [Ruminococcus flavefaciens]
MYSEEDFLMLSGIQHFAFCRRQWAIIHIEQQWDENYRTTAGELMHKKAHDENSFEKRGDLLTVRGLRISSHALGISGQCDVVEFHQDEKGVELFGYDGRWQPVPVEYKRGVPKENNADELQLCAQALCLEEMFQTNIVAGYLYYGENRRRTYVEFTDSLREEVKKITVEMHDLFNKGYTPNVKPKKQCKACSLENLCIPKLQKMTKVREYIEHNIKIND